MDSVFGIIVVGIFVVAAVLLAPRQGPWRRGGDYDAGGDDGPIESPQPVDVSPQAPPDIVWSYAGSDASACPAPDSGTAVPRDPPPPPPP